MAAKVINFHSPDGKNTYELTFTRDSVEAVSYTHLPSMTATSLTFSMSRLRSAFSRSQMPQNSLA